MWGFGCQGFGLKLEGFRGWGFRVRVSEFRVSGFEFSGSGSFWGTFQVSTVLFVTVLGPPVALACRFHVIRVSLRNKGYMVRERVP